MTQRPVNIVLVVDDEDDYHLTVNMLSEVEDTVHTVTWVRSFEAGIECLTKESTDICLVDYRIGERCGLEFVQAVQRLGDPVPIILLTGMDNPQTDLDAMEAGSYDFLRKSELTAVALDQAIRYSIKLAESRRVLLERTVLLQATLDNTGAAIGAVDRSGKLVTWNDRFSELLIKLTNNLEHDKPLFDADGGLLNFDLDKELPLFASSWDEFDAGDGCLLNIRRNGIADGGAVIVCHDITGQKQAEQALRDAIYQAQAASASKSAFLANISHEFRTPLNAIIGFSELMLGQSHGPLTCPEHEDYLSVIKQSGDSLLQTINTTIDLSRIEAGEYKLDPVEVMVSDLIHSALGPLRQPAGDKNLEFEVEVESNDLSLDCDENAMGKVIAQLLSNAIKFSEHGGIVSISAYQDDGAVYLEVTDQGIGMKPDEIRRALSSFSQIDQQFARKYEGAGLGLPLACALLKLLGGRMTISSDPDAGTTVAAIVPKSRDFRNELGEQIVSETVALSA